MTGLLLLHEERFGGRDATDDVASERVNGALGTGFSVGGDSSLFTHVGGNLVREGLRLTQGYVCENGFRNREAADEIREGDTFGQLDVELGMFKFRSLHRGL